MTATEADAVVRSALAQLLNAQPQLFLLDVSERAITHHLAHYIGSLVDADLNVDIEYNRHHDDPKRLNLPHREALDTDIRATTVFPDIIVHVRDTDERNLLVLELKKRGEPTDYDALKLRAFKNELGYRHAAHVTVGVDAAGEPYGEVEWLVG